MASDNNLSLNLYAMPTTCCIVVISENQELVRRKTIDKVLVIEVRG